MTTDALYGEALAFTHRRALAEDAYLVAALRRGDEVAFVALLDAYQATMLRLALHHVGSYAVAEEVVPQTWLDVLRSLEGFEGRSSLKTWIFTILTNRAKTRGQRESRCLPFSSYSDPDADADEPAVAPERFQKGGQWSGGWASAPQRWGDAPEHALLAGEIRTVITAAVASLPANQREVITLRDIEGWSAAEVCRVLGRTEVHQRVLLHRARSRVRDALERYFDTNNSVTT